MSEAGMAATLMETMPEQLRRAIKSAAIEGDVVRLSVDGDALPQIATWLHSELDVALITEHGVDERFTSGMYRLVVLLSVAGSPFISLEAEISATDPSYPSLTPTLFCANWFERETQDMLGLVPVGHPDPRPLVLYDDWPEGVHPLRKDFDATTKVPRVDRPYPFRRVEGSGVFEIPVGPVHAGIIEPGHFRFSVAGEPIINLEVRLGYAHKGVEKLFEATPYAYGVYLAERVSGDNSFAHSLAYCQAVERLAGVEAPERARFIRSILAELERIDCHLGDVGGIALDTAFNVAAHHAFILKEKVLNLNDCLTGSRLLRSANRIGGVWRDIEPGMLERISQTLVKVELELEDFVDLAKSSPSFLERVETTGVITHEQTRQLNLVGPAARASGLDRDVRRDHPYAAYGKLDFQVPLRQDGDVNARFQVRIDELQESFSMVREALQEMPSGPIFQEATGIPEGKMAFSLVESPRGELLHWLKSGPDGRPFRHKIVDPSFRNWPAIEVAVQGNIVPDFPLINKSLNLSYSGSDL
jgi:Ni,Fe-hydrogenase III large subunit/Ni,Fe-hydrogenase III component G